MTPEVVLWAFLIFDLSGSALPQASMPFQDRAVCEMAAARVSRANPAYLIPLLEARGSCRAERVPVCVAPSAVR